jgi:hypothetical protein
MLIQDLYITTPVTPAPSLLGILEQPLRTSMRVDIGAVTVRPVCVVPSVVNLSGVFDRIDP